MIRSLQISFRSTSNPFCLKNTLSQVLQFLQSSTNQSPIRLIFIWLELSNATTYDSTEFICMRNETLSLPVSGLMCPFILRGLVLISNDVKFFTQNLLGQDLPLLEGKTWPHLKRGDKSKPLKQQGKPTDYSGWECGGSFQGRILSASLLVGPVVTSLFISQASSLEPQFCKFHFFSVMVKDEEYVSPHIACSGLRHYNIIPAWWREATELLACTNTERSCQMELV